MLRRRNAALALAALGALACLAPSSSPCGDGYCPPGTVCQPVASADAGPGEPARCVLRADQCTGAADGTLCAGDRRSICVGGACQASICGDAVIDPDRPEGPELCDDGSGTGGNGPEPNRACRGTCLPARCGDGVVDDAPAAGGAPEICDDGEANSNVLPAICRATCQFHTCGDGVVDSEETIGCWGQPQIIAEQASIERTLVVDLDGDGLVDLVQPNGDPATGAVHFRFGREDGGFDFAAQLFASTPEPLATGDFDGDGDLDLVGNAGALGFVRNLGGRVFEDAGEIDLFPYAVVPGDFDDDGDDDLVIGDADGLWFLESQGAGGFAAPVPVSTFVPDYSLDAGDVSGDGVPDLVGLGTELVALVSGGDGSFAAPLVIDVNEPGARLWTVRVADLDADGDADVVTTDVEQGAVHAYRSLGAGGFAAPVVSMGLDLADELAVGDLDGIGLLDLVLLGGVGRHLRVLRGYPPVTYLGSDPMGIDQDLGSFFLAIADLDHDGFADIVGQGFTTWVAHGGDGPVGPRRRVDRAASFAAVTVADLDGDARADLVYTVVDDFAASAGPPRMVRSRGARRFDAAATLSTSARCRALAIADFDGDGRRDVACAGVDRFSLVRGLPGGGFAEGASTAHADAAPVTLRAGDLDGDGRADLVAIFGARGTAVHVVRLAGQEDGSFGAAAPFVSDAAGVATDAELGDVDGDGRPDLVLATAAGLVWHAGLAGGGFAAARAIDAPAAVRLFAGDLDEDGDLDLLVVDASGGLRALLGDGAGGFTGSAAGTGGVRAAAALADVNGDGHLDLTDGAPDGAAEPFAGIRYGDGRGGFSVRASTDLIGLVAAGDVTGDGRADLVGASGTPQELSVSVGRFSLAP